MNKVNFTAMINSEVENKVKGETCELLSYRLQGQAGIGNDDADNLGILLISRNMEVLTVSKQMSTWFPDVEISKCSICHEVIRGKKRYEICRNCPAVKTLKDGRIHEYTYNVLIQDEQRIYRMTSFPLKDKDEAIIAVLQVVEDITERKRANEDKARLEEQLFQAQKMESIGRLAGGIVHDLNNILTGIMGYADMLRIKYPDVNTSDGKAVNVISKCAEEAAALTKHLLNISRKGGYYKAPLCVNEVIKDVLEVLEKVFEKNITLIFDCCEDINPIEGDKNQIYHMLMNVVINAKDAMPYGGELTIKTENVCIDEECAEKYMEFNTGDYVKISIADTGTGMSKEVIGNIFEPFYTTKEKGKGTGLGLAMVCRIVKNHGGHIGCRSEIDKGTTFTVYFPSSEKKVHKEILNEKIVKGSETILIVDDEESIRELAKEQLNYMGYEVILADNGLNAVEIYRENKSRIDLVLLDMIMPYMNGQDAYKELKKINPDVKVLLVSGFTETGRASEILKEGVLGFVQKPFKLYKLSEVIHDVLKK